MKLLIFCLLLLSNNLYADFTHESELAAISSGGNSDINTYLARTTNQVQSEENTIRFGGHYTYGEAGENVSAREWTVNGKYEKMITAKMAYLIGEVLESYRFQGIKVRYNTDLGLKYYYVRTDERNVFTELGYRYTIEDRYSPEENQNEHKGRLYNEFFHKPEKKTQYKFALEYIPNFTNSKDYLVNGEASITSFLNDVFSIKVSYRFSYDDEPAIPGNTNYDYTYSTAFVAKF